MKPFEYSAIKEEERKETVAARTRDLEREHFSLSLSLAIAEAKLAKGIPRAENEVVDLHERLAVLELSIHTLGQLDS